LTTAILANKTAFSRERDNRTNSKPATGATATRNDQQFVTRSDDETAATTTAIAGRASNGDFQRLACGQAEVAADLGTATTWAGLITKPSASPLRAKGEDLIRVGGRHREGDKAPGISEVEWCRARGQP
jgi:hypothetical protein